VGQAVGDSFWTQLIAIIWIEQPAIDVIIALESYKDSGDFS